ncbi:uncharacterized protein LOC117597041 [Pangasianodon hypophthalmus]|uniref:uncharacterized protein LOC117597041 n=1 Tax=Pangasianodon hypophthalmus TaxID=310915 RepID=UPI0023071EEC|nr:uncharacterized protein LOC117597041 [Pangasianodon hypophthalmus]
MKEKDRVFLMDAPLAPSGLFGDTVSSVVDRYQEARTQAVAFQRFLPRRSLALGAAGWEQPPPCASSSYQEAQKQSSGTGSSKCPWEIDLPTLPPMVLQGAAVSCERSSKSPPGNVAVLGGLLPLRSSPEQLVRPSSAGPPLQGTELAALVTPEREATESIRFSTASFLRDSSHFGGSRAGSGNGKGSAGWNTLLRKEAIKVVPPHDRQSGFCSRYFIVPKKGGGLRPILDLHHLNRSLMRLKFKMLMIKQVVSQISSEDWYICLLLGSILTAVARVREGWSLTVKWFQKLLGLMAAASNVIPFGLLYMRPLQWWLKTKGFSLRGSPLRMIKVTRRCLGALDMWRKPWFLSQGPVLGASCCRVTLAKDASLTGWGAVMSLWSGRYLTWHINCLEMLAVFLALKHFLPDLGDRHVLVRTDNTAVVSYINHQGGLRSRPLYRLAHQILEWSQGKLLSLRAVYIPGHLNMGADALSRQGPKPGEWRLHPDVVKQIWRVFGQAQVDLFATQETSHCPLWFSLTHPAPLGLDAMVQTWPRMRLYAFSAFFLERVRRDGVHLLLVAPFWSMVLGPDFPSRRLSMGDSRQEGSPLTGGGRHLPPPPGVVEAVSVASEGAQLVASGLSAEVVETILQSRTPSSRKLYALRWKLFTSWCEDRRLDPVNSPVGTVLEFLQARLSAGLTHSTLKVYLAAIAAYHAPHGGQSVGRHPLDTHFLQGALRLRPPVRSRVPPWDLAVVLEALCKPPFEPIEGISDRLLAIKTAFLLAISSLKRVGDLQALSVAPSYLDFAPGLAKAFLYPRVGYVPKIPSSTPWPVVLQAFCPPPFREPDQRRLNCMCPLRALNAYIHRAALWRRADQLFVCFGPPKRGLPATRQTLSRWIVDAICLAYESSDLPSPLGVKAHSTRSVAASKAFLAGVSMQNICNAAGRSTPLTFTRFYGLDMRATPGSSVLLP